MVSWFEGNVNEAIVEAKKRGSLFVVAIDFSSGGLKARMDSYSTLSSLLSSLATVNLMLDAESELRRHFCAIYPVNKVPAVVVIDSNNGSCLNSVEGEVDDEQKIVELINEAKERMGGNQQAKSNDDGAKAEGHNDSESNSGSGDLTLEERVAKAKQMMAERRNQREQQSQLAEDRSEQVRRQQEEQSIKDAAAERRKEKEEAKRAKERIKAQIEEDRRNRAARFEEEHRRRMEEREDKKSNMDKENVEERASNRSLSSEARVQFRLPDGSSHSRRFGAENSLQVLYDCVRNELNLSNFSLTTTFPRQELDALLDSSSTLNEVGLVPSGTVLVLAKSSSVIASNNYSLDYMWQQILLPFLFIWRLVISLFNSATSLSNNSDPNTTTTSATTTAVTPDDSSRETLRRRRLREGNITRLGDISGSNDDNDENNTWNGNSTQQM